MRACRPPAEQTRATTGKFLRQPQHDDILAAERAEPLSKTHSRIVRFMKGMAYLHPKVGPR